GRGRNRLCGRRRRNRRRRSRPRGKGERLRRRRRWNRSRAARASARRLSSQTAVSGIGAPRRSPRRHASQGTGSGERGGRGSAGGTIRRPSRARFLRQGGGEKMAFRARATRKRIGRGLGSLAGQVRIAPMSNNNAKSNPDTPLPGEKIRVESSLLF